MKTRSVKQIRSIVVTELLLYANRSFARCGFKIKTTRFLNFTSSYFIE